MLKIPDSIQNQYIGLLNNKNVPVRVYNYYIKWFRYYLDYCYKYRFPELNQSSLPQFINKLKEKNQKPFQQKQASTAIHIFYELEEQNPHIKISLGSIQKQWQKNEYDTSISISEKSFQKNEKLSYKKKSLVSCGNTNKNNQKWQNVYQ